MKISTKGRYALRVMLDLSMHAQEGYVPLREIAERQEISPKYLEAIASMLGKAGFIHSMRGKDGGYVLTRRAEEYTVGEIIKLAEGSLSPVSCLDCGGVCDCPRASDCLTLPMWRGLDRVIDEYLEGVTLADLLERRVAE